MANFLFCSLDAALIGDIAWQVSREGHDVRYYIEADSDQEIADGFVPKTDDWRGDLGWADVVVFDDIWVGGDIGTGELAQELRAEGHAVVGGTPNTDALEEDRGYAMEVLEDHGVNTIEHHVFETSTPASSTSRRTLRRTSSNRSGKSRTSSDCSTSGTRTTAATSSMCFERTRRHGATG